MELRKTSFQARGRDWDERYILGAKKNKNDNNNNNNNNNNNKTLFIDLKKK